MGFPNIGIVVGDRATLVVDTGMGPRNGQTIARVAAKLSKSPKLFLTTTHFHPSTRREEAGFPPGAVLLRNTAQQKEMELHGQEMIDQFSSRSAVNKDLLADARMRAPDILFDSELKVDLARRYRAPAVVRRRAYQRRSADLRRARWHPDLRRRCPEQDRPQHFRRRGDAASWLAVLDKIAALDVKHVLPDHSAPGDGSLVAAERNFISDLRTRALALKGQGITADDAAKQLTTEFKAKYADWPNMNVTGFVRSIYAEN